MHSTILLDYVSENCTKISPGITELFTEIVLPANLAGGTISLNNFVNTYK